MDTFDPDMHEIAMDEEAAHLNQQFVEPYRPTNIVEVSRYGSAKLLEE